MRTLDLRPVRRTKMDHWTHPARDGDSGFGRSATENAIDALCLRRDHVGGGDRAVADRVRTAANGITGTAGINIEQP